MGSPALQEILALAAEPAARAQTIDYLAHHLQTFLKKGERVLICFLDQQEGSIGWLMEQAVLQCNAVPVAWGPDHRWKSLLQQAFYSRASTIIGLPLIILGLTKLKKYNGIPLYIRHVVMAGYPCLDWMIDGIVSGLDCKTLGCFSLSTTGVVVGFSCGKSRAVHIRDSVYGVDIVNDAGMPVSPGEVGEIVLYPKDRPELRHAMGEQARLVTAPCPCGCRSHRLMGMSPGKDIDIDLLNLGQQLQSWTSVLDCRLNKGEYGLELEMIVFPGEKLPRLPSAAKQVIRPWDPKHDEPFPYVPTLKNLDFDWESH